MAYALAAATTAQAARTWTVTRTDDTSGGSCEPTSCSLRQAIGAAGGGDTVVIPASSVPYVVTTGNLFVAHPVTITGAGAAASVIDLNHENHGLYFEAGSEHSTLANLTIENRTGGEAAIHAEAAAAGGLAISGCIITDNRSTSAGGGIFAAGGGTLAISRTVISHNSGTVGGGIDTIDETSVTESEISANTAELEGAQGGGIYSSAKPLTISASTLDRNVAASLGSAGPAEGGGLYHVGAGTLTITDSTVAFNEAVPAAGGTTFGRGGGIATSAGAPASLTWSTVADNRASGELAVGGNIYEETGANTMSLRDSIVADGTASTAGKGDCAPEASRFTSLGHNIESADQCGLQHGGSDFYDTEPQLQSTLTDNGGPTLTLAPGSAASPAVAHGESAPTCPGTDQRGLVRPTGTACDIGAVELIAPTLGESSVVTTGMSTATVSTNVNIWGASGSILVQYGPTSVYGSQTTPLALGLSTVLVPVTIPLGGLTAGVTYHARVLASTPAGNATSADLTFTTPSAPSAPKAPTPTVSIAAGSVRLDRHGRARFKLTCHAPSGGACSGTLTMRTAGPVPLRAASARRRSGGHHKTGRRVVTLGSARFTIANGRTATVTIKVRRKGIVLVRRAKHGLAVTLRASYHDSSGVTNATNARGKLLPPAQKPRKHRNSRSGR